MSRQTPVSEVMTTEVLVFPPDANVGDAMRLMVEQGIDGAPVVDGEGRVVGMLSTGDLIVPETKLHFPLVIELLGAHLELPSSRRDFNDDLRRTLGSTVADLMAEDPVTVDPGETLETAATLLHDHQISRMPVVGEHGLVGLISRTDILRAMLRDEPGGSGTAGSEAAAPEPAAASASSAPASAAPEPGA